MRFISTVLLFGTLFFGCANLERDGGGGKPPIDEPSQVDAAQEQPPTPDAAPPITPDAQGECDPPPPPECVCDSDCDQPNGVCRNDHCYTACERDEQCPHGDMSCHSGICRYDTNHGD